MADAVPSSKPADPFVPISTAKANAIYAPDPPQEELAATASAMKTTPISTTVSFCVDTSGVTRNIGTTVESSDPKVDSICRNTVSKWRFKPFMNGGVAVKMCSTVEFRIAFE